MESKKIIDELYFCAAQCENCYNACQQEEDKDQLKYCMISDQDCGEICRLTGQILERNSENGDLFLKLCAEICEKCAVECEKHSHFEHCKECSEVCSKCAEMCRTTRLIYSKIIP